MRIGCPTCAATAHLRMQSKGWLLLSSESAPKPLVKRPAQFVVVLALALVLERALERSSLARTLAENGGQLEGAAAKKTANRSGGAHISATYTTRPAGLFH